VIEISSCNACGDSGCCDLDCERCHPARDAVAELSRILKECGARVTFDPERSIAKPCMICGTTEQPRDLVKIGTWSRHIGGHAIGDAITRPLCASCEEMTR
jgi:hypothetical protein